MMTIWGANPRLVALLRTPAPRRSNYAIGVGCANQFRSSSYR
jgi:hypothetical protein